MKDYYTEVSHGLFTVSAGAGGIAGWFTATSGHDYYGANNAAGDDTWPGDLVYQAVQAADNAGFNFAPYDQDGDCRVDVTNIVHQGTGEESGVAATDIWSHSWSLAGAQYSGNSHYGAFTTHTACTAGGYIRVDRYVIEPEIYSGRISTVGVFAHEYAHALGLPDLYDYGYDSAGVGMWSLMAIGAWSGVTRGGDRPTHLDAWSKAKLGWLTPTQITSAVPTAVTIAPATTTASAYQFRSGSPAAGIGEYFLIENRQRTGFDAPLPSAGMLVWHIDEAMSNNNRQCVPVGASCATTHYKVALVQADNLWQLERNQFCGDAGDPYPGTSNRIALNDTSTPASLLYSGAPSGVNISNIAISGTNITAALSILATGTGPTAPSNLTATTSSASRINLAWVDNSTNETGFRIARKIGAAGLWTELATTAANVISFPSTTLTGGTTYYYRVRAYHATGTSGYSNEAFATTTACTPATIAIGVGGTLSGTLATTDCQSAVRTGSYYDNVTFTAVAGTTYTITMNSTAFDTYLLLLNSAGTVVALNDDFSGTSNSGIVYTATAAGAMRIYATSFASNATGAYRVSLVTGTPPTAPSGLTAVTASAARINLAWVDNSTNETGFRIARTSGAAGVWTEIATTAANVISFSSTALAAGTTYYYRVRAYNAAGTSGYSEAFATTTTACTPSTTAIGVGGTVSGTLATTDCQSAVRAGMYYDNLTFTAVAGTTYTITMNSTAFDTYLLLLNSAGTVVALNDNYRGTNSQIVYTAPAAGAMRIYATSYGANAVGAYTVTRN